MAHALNYLAGIRTAAHAPMLTENQKRNSIFLSIGYHDDSTCFVPKFIKLVCPLNLLKLNKPCSYVYLHSSNRVTDY